MRIIEHVRLSKYTKHAVTAFFSPLFAIFLNPVALIKTLSSCAVLYGRRWPDYGGFSIRSAILKLFYVVQFRNMKRYGLRGSTPTMGGGNFDLRRLWYQSVFALSLYSAVGGAVSNLMGLAVYFLAHLFWLDKVNEIHVVVLAAALSVVSTNGFWNFFERQNYNVFSWAIFPIGVYAILTQNYGVALFSFTLISLLSITAFAATALLTFTWSILVGDPWLALTILPGCIKYLMLDIAGIFHGEIRSAFLRYAGDLLGAIGANKSRLRLRRPPRWISAFLSSCVLGVFPLVAWLGTEDGSMDLRAKLSVLSLVVVGWFFVNQARIFRIADPQSILMCFLCVTTATIIVVPEVDLFVAFWVANSNAVVGLILGSSRYTTEKLVYGAYPLYPVDIRPVLEAFEQLLIALPSGQRVLLAVKDPGKDYNSLFAECYPMNEVVNYLCDAKQSTVIPDLHAVYSMDNQLSGLRFWGIEPREVVANMRALGVTYAIVPIRDDCRDAYAEHGLSEVGRLDRSIFWIVDELDSGADAWCDWRLIFLGNEHVSV